MLSYDKLKDKPREFLAATGLTLVEFERLLPAFQVVYEHQYPPALTYEGKVRQRRAGGGAQGTLSSFADKLLFILVYHKTNPLQVMHGLQCALSQAQTHYWVHRLLARVALVYVWIDNQEVEQVYGVKPHHLWYCDALGLDRSWYKAPSSQKTAGTFRSLERGSQGTQVQHRSPAMAARLTDHMWTVREWLLYPV
jgi:hypothetical protein